MKKFLTGLIITILVILIGAGVYYYVKTNSGTEESTPGFYVELHSGEKLTSNSTNLMLVKGASYTFKVSQEYNLNLLPNVDNAENNFTFTIDNESKQFFAELNLHKGFNIEVKENEFTITLAQEENVKSILERIYDGKTVEVPEDIVNSEEYLFSFYVSDKENENLYIINFGITEKLSVTLPGEIVF